MILKMKQWFLLKVLWRYFWEMWGQNDDIIFTRTEQVHTWPRSAIIRNYADFTFFFVVTLTKWEWVGFEARLRYEYLPTITTLMYVYILFTILWSRLFSPRGSRTKCENNVELWFLWKNPNWTVLRTPLVFSPELMGKVVYYTERKC